MGAVASPAAPLGAPPPPPPPPARHFDTSIPVGRAARWRARAGGGDRSLGQQPRGACAPKPCPDTAQHHPLGRAWPPRAPDGWRGRGGAGWRAGGGGDGCAQRREQAEQGGCSACAGERAWEERRARLSDWRRARVSIATSIDERMPPRPPVPAPHVFTPRICARAHTHNTGRKGKVGRQAPKQGQKGPLAAAGGCACQSRTCARVYFLAATYRSSTLSQLIRFCGGGKGLALAHARGGWAGARRMLVPPAAAPRQSWS